MKLQRFCVAGPISTTASPLTIPSLELVNQLKHVLRLPLHTTVSIFDGSGFDYLASIESYGKGSVSLTILEKHENSVKPPRETWLFAAVVKKANFEWIVEKATELGVSHIVPIVTDRTEKQGLNRNRLTKVSIEAAEQSGRGTVPEIHDILKLADAIANYSYLPSVVWEPKGAKFERNDLHTTVSTYIGPEGGWTERELTIFKENKIPVLSLGPQILRAETAVVAALSQIVF